MHKVQEPDELYSMCTKQVGERLSRLKVSHEVSSSKECAAAIEPALGCRSKLQQQSERRQCQRGRQHLQKHSSYEGFFPFLFSQHSRKCSRNMNYIDYACTSKNEGEDINTWMRKQMRRRELDLGQTYVCEHPGLPVPSLSLWVEGCLPFSKWHHGGNRCIRTVWTLLVECLFYSSFWLRAFAWPLNLTLEKQTNI